MPSLSSTSTTRTVKAIFAFDVIVAGLALIFCLVGISLVITRFKNKRTQYHDLGKNAPLKSTLSTHAFLIPSLFFLCLQYAILAAIVAFQLAATFQQGSITITTGYSYFETYNFPEPTQREYIQTISGLSFAKQFAEIVFTLCLNGAVWLHSSHVMSNGTGVGQPSALSKIWNTIILLLIAATGFAAWGEALVVRDGTSLNYSEAVDNDLATRALHITFRCIVIFTSISVATEVVKRWTNLNKNGIPGNPERPILRRFTFVVVPLIVLRDAFIVVSIVMLYVNYTDLGRNSRQATAFLLIIFGQLTNLTILFMVLWGAWSMGRSAGKTSGMG